jgi:glutaredoxin
LDFEEDEVEDGEQFTCPDCNADLEVVSTNPLELGVVDEEDEEEEEAEESEEEEEEPEDDSFH